MQYVDDFMGAFYLKEEVEIFLARATYYVKILMVGGAARKNTSATASSCHNGIAYNLKIELKIKKG